MSAHPFDWCRVLVVGGLALALCPPATLAQQAQTKTVDVEVVEVAAGRAYLAPGEQAGLHRGDSVQLGGQGYTVVGATAAHVVIDLEGSAVKVGARGRATVSGTADAERERLPTPRPLAAFRGQWPDARLPADAQHPRAVPLGPMDAADSTRLMVSLGGAGIVPLGGNGEPIARSELRGRLHYEPFHELPTRLDADVATQLWLASDLDARAGRDSQPPARVRELALSHGYERELFAALGRLRYASRALGMLDGAKVQAGVGPDFTLGAFGGFVPDPIDGSPTTDASRFGAEIGWEDLTLATRPRAVLTAHGSRFDGGLDERRLNAFFDMFPGTHRLGAHAELSIHGADNPWKAPAKELSAAGADVGLRFGDVDLGARFDMQRPERSRWLASFVPLEWLCITQRPDAAGDPEPCYGDETRYLGSADAGVRFGQLALHAGTTASTSNRGDTDQVGGFVGATVLRVVDELRVDTSLMASTGSLLRSYAGSVGLGMPFAHGLVDVSLRYRPAWTRYIADTGAFLEHGVGAHLDVAPAGELSFSLDADAITGRDLDVLLLQALLTYRLLGG